MDGVDKVDESLGHDEAEDEAHADHYGIGRCTHPAKEEVRTVRNICLRINLGGRSSAMTTQMRVP